MNLRAAALALITLALSGAACGGRLTPSPVEGEPVCTDFEIGAAMMRGSLRFPVALTVLDDDKPLTRTTLSGLRTKDEPPSRVLLADDDAEYVIEWAQCENERAPRPVVETSKSRDASEYACGKAEVYKTDKLVTRKGDAKSRVLTFPTPPKPACWQSEVPPAAQPPTASASAPPPPAPAADGGAEPADAGAAADEPNGDKSAGGDKKPDNAKKSDGDPKRGGDAK